MDKHTSDLKEDMQMVTNHYRAVHGVTIERIVEQLEWVKQDLLHTSASNPPRACAYCGTLFTAPTEFRLYCPGKSCKVLAWRQRQKTGRSAPGRWGPHTRKWKTRTSLKPPVTHWSDDTSDLP